jgi:hypothetical protein
MNNGLPPHQTFIRHLIRILKVSFIVSVQKFCIQVWCEGKLKNAFKALLIKIIILFRGRKSKRKMPFFGLNITENIFSGTKKG